MHGAVNLQEADLTEATLAHADLSKASPHYHIRLPASETGQCATRTCCTLDADVPGRTLLQRAVDISNGMAGTQRWNLDGRLQQRNIQSAPPWVRTVSGIQSLMSVYLLACGC
jgi:uncharacterized protein YjbI with pentapeptide repeats